MTHAAARRSPRLSSADARHDALAAHHAARRFARIAAARQATATCRAVAACAPATPGLKKLHVLYTAIVLNY
eukprot:SAG31_NODE_618_length_13513_cov_87.043164_3_plen_72_part_00